MSQSTRHHIPVIALFALALAWAAASAMPSRPPAQTVTPESLTAQVDAILSPVFKPGTPGAVVLVMKDGKPLVRKAYGMADLELGVP